MYNPCLYKVYYGVASLLEKKARLNAPTKYITSTHLIPYKPMFISEAKSSLRSFASAFCIGIFF